MSEDLTIYERYRFGEERLAAGDPLAAARALEPAVEQETANASLWLLLARAYFASARLRPAQEAFERVVELDPTDHHARFGLGRTFERQSRYQEALAQYRVALALSPDPDYSGRVPYELVDPFILVHEGRVRLSPEIAKMDSKHPHRGFDNLWYMIEGSISTGHSTGPGGAMERARLTEGSLLFLSKLVGAVLQATGSDLSRQSFMATLQSGQDFATNVYPVVSYSGSVRFGAKSAHLLEADRPNRRFKTIAQFTAGF